MTIFSQIISYFKEVRAETLKVNWPSRRVVINHTIIVLVALLVMMLVVAAFDYGLIYLLRTVLLRE